jgi:hypothetical protein
MSGRLGFISLLAPRFAIADCGVFGVLTITQAGLFFGESHRQ